MVNSDMPLRFRVSIEDSKSREKEIEAIFLRKGMLLAEEKGDAEVIFTHESDAKFPEESLERKYAEENGHYIAYSGVGYEKKKAIFEKLKPPVTKTSLHDALNSPLPELKFLPALAILCQGYLAVHASEDGEEFSSALTDMGLGQVTLREEVRSSLSSDLANRIEEVNDVKWWSCVFGNDDLEEQLKGELGLVDEDKGDLLPSIKNLSDFITGQSGESRLSRKVVSAAYSDLADELKKSTCWEL